MALPSSDGMEYHTPLIHHYWGEGGIEYLTVPSLPSQSHSSVAIFQHHLPSGTRPSCSGGGERRAAGDSGKRDGRQQISGGGVGEGDQWGGRSVQADGRAKIWQTKLAASWLCLLVVSTNS
jgi:hypothetical protein